MTDDLERWGNRPASFSAWIRDGVITTWSGAVLGTITENRVAASGMKGVTLRNIRVTGNNGAEYWGRTDDRVSFVRLRLYKPWSTKNSRSNRHGVQKPRPQNSPARA